MSGLGNSPACPRPRTERKRHLQRRLEQFHPRRHAVHTRRLRCIRDKFNSADADGDALTLTIRNLPPGARFDAATGILSWTPGYDQAGRYDDITVVASDGKRSVRQSFGLTVEQAYPAPVLSALAPQTLREGDRYSLQLLGQLPGESVLADGTTVTLEYAAPWLPGGATLNPETGGLEWTPGYAQQGNYTIPLKLIATWTTPDGRVTQTTATRELTLEVLNANGAPVFDATAGETWNVLEGQPLKISVFALDPDNPAFEPKIRFYDGAEAFGPETTAPTVSYQVQGLPEGAVFDPETLEIVWTPGYAQAGTYTVIVTATDDGDGTGAPLSRQLVLPIMNNRGQTTIKFWN
jgi:hypothetical protein